MYNQLNSVSRKVGKAIITISEINVDKRWISGYDAYKRIYTVSFASLPPLVSIPVVGEKWIITKYNSEYQLENRFESGTENVPLSRLSPGDTRVDTPGTVHLGGQSIVAHAPITISPIDSTNPPEAPAEGGTLYIDNGAIRVIWPDGTINTLTLS